MTPAGGGSAVGSGSMAVASRELLQASVVLSVVGVWGSGEH